MIIKKVYEPLFTFYFDDLESEKKLNATSKQKKLKNDSFSSVGRLCLQNINSCSPVNMKIFIIQIKSFKFLILPKDTYFIILF